MASRKGYHQVVPGYLVRDDNQAEAVRYYQTEGATFSGWIVRSVWDKFSYSDAIPTKAEAVEALLVWDLR